MAGIKGMKHYSAAIKREAIRLHQEEGMTNKEIMDRLKIVSERRVRFWCQKYRDEGQLGIEPKTKGRPRKVARTDQEQIAYELKMLKMENELLKNFLFEAGRR